LFPQVNSALPTKNNSGKIRGTETEIAAQSQHVLISKVQREEGKKCVWAQLYFYRIVKSDFFGLQYQEKVLTHFFVPLSIKSKPVVINFSPIYIKERVYTQPFFP